MKTSVPWLDSRSFGSSSRTDFIQTPGRQCCGQDLTHILQCARHAFEKAEQQEMRDAFLALVGISFGVNITKPLKLGAHVSGCTVGEKSVCFCRQVM